MTQSELMCPHCGWRNEETARMCGGCGQPLRDSSAGPLRPASGSPYGAASYANDAPTSLSAGVEAPRNARAGPPGGGTPAAWPGPGNIAGASQAPQSARGWRRALLIVFVVLLVLAFGGVAAWSGIIRPAVHNAVDTQLRADFARAIQSIPGDLPPVPYQITAADANDYLVAHPPTDSRLQDLQVHFSDNGIILTYTYNGSDGSVKTTLLSNGGGIKVSGTTVTGALSVFESGDEMEAALNAGLANWPRTDKVTDIHTDGDTLFMTVSR
jgi:hypothetical protein